MDKKRANVLQLSLFLAAFSLFATSCGKKESKPLQPEGTSFMVTPRGSDESLEIVTWNLEMFPLDGKNTVRLVEQIIEDLDVDLFAIQEISDTVSFRQLLQELDWYDGLYSSDVYSKWYQKTAILYKHDLISIDDAHPLFEGDSYAFPRPPLELSVIAQKNGRTFDFQLIVLHLKAGGEQDDFRRRRAAAEALKEHLDEQLDSPYERDFVVAGDWNDEIDEHPDYNAFMVFLEDSLNYRFLTQPLAGDPRLASYPSYKSLIDHILLSRDAFDEYRGGEATTLLLDDEVNDYLQKVSDHRPVMATFPVFSPKAER